MADPEEPGKQSTGSWSDSVASGLVFGGLGSDPVAFVVFLVGVSLLAATLWLVGWPIARFRRKIDSTPSRHWNEIGWAYRIGRLGLITSFLGLLLSPLWWLVPR